MSTLSIQAPSPSKFWALPYAALKRTASFTLMFIDSIAEARRLADEAQQRYPFVR
jgi:hypothetical protein